MDEKPVISETEFTAKKSSGSVKVTFTFDATSLKGKTTVVFEELYQDEMQLAVHTDINDMKTRPSFPGNQDYCERCGHELQYFLCKGRNHAGGYGFL